MKLAASQIAWAPEEEAAALKILRKYGFSGLEVAPTMAVGPQPYKRPEAGAEYAARIKSEYGLAVCSLQSIWYGQAGSLFGPERAQLLDYTKQAILFAEAAGAGNLVFGSPKNRVRPAGVPEGDALPFFKELGDFAAAHGTVLALEANPAVYGTNFMNTTAEALAVAAQAQSPGLRVNLDFGTILINGEDVAALAGQVSRISHVHISEPQLAPLRAHEGHRALARLLHSEGYAGYVSIEMRRAPLAVLEQAALLLAEVFA